MADLMLLGSFIAGPFLTVMEETFEFTLEALRAVGYCFEIYFWILIAALIFAIMLVVDKDSEGK